MTELIIEGGNVLTGEVEIGGAKNSVVALMPAAILGDRVRIEKVPEISDVENLKTILEYLGVKIEKEKETYILDMSNLENKPFSKDEAKKLRASYYFMGALLARFGKCEIYHPGGCVIGERPIDLHLNGFKALGATVEENDNKYIISAEKLIGNTINLRFPSVGATINIMIAASRAQGTTTINNVAMEPEIDNVIELLNSLGAKVKRENDSIIVEGVSQMHEGKVRVIPDRIEAGTYVIAGVLAGDNLKVTNVIPKHLTALISVLNKIEANIKVYDDYIIVSKNGELKPIDVIAEPYPGFPTDLQQPLTTLLSTANGVSHITETIYENRFRNVEYLNQMGADIEINGNQITINGPKELTGGNVVSTDLRAGACLVIAGLIGKGTTRISSIEHIIRGYEHLTEKMSKINANIKIN